MEESISRNFFNILKGVIISIIFTLIFLFVFSIILTYTNISESTIPVVTIIITAISILAGSAITTLHIRKNGAINGGLVGIIYILSLYIISSLVTGCLYAIIDNVSNKTSVKTYFLGKHACKI